MHGDKLNLCMHVSMCTHVHISASMALLKLITEAAASLCGYSSGYALSFQRKHTFMQMHALMQHQIRVTQTPNIYGLKVYIYLLDMVKHTHSTEGSRQKIAEQTGYSYSCIRIIITNYLARYGPIFLSSALQHCFQI